MFDIATQNTITGRTGGNATSGFGRSTSCAWSEPRPPATSRPTEPARRAARRRANSPARRRWPRSDQYASKDARAGTYVLHASHTDWDLGRGARTYWQLTEFEAAFRSLQSEIGLRPIWHAKQDRIRAHLFIAVLAYHGLHVLRLRLGAHGIHDG